jgi:hypothetical protein
VGLLCRFSVADRSRRQGLRGKPLAAFGRLRPLTPALRPAAWREGNPAFNQEMSMLSTRPQNDSLDLVQRGFASEESSDDNRFFSDEEDFWRRGAHGVAPASGSLNHQVFLDMASDVPY